MKRYVAGLRNSSTSVRQESSEISIAGSECVYGAFSERVLVAEGRGHGLDNSRWPNRYFADLGLFSLKAVRAKVVQSSRR